jgi:hypothetical protein
MAAAPPAFAATLAGTVTTIEDDLGAFRITRTDVSGLQDIEIRLRDDTRWSGIESAGRLRAGDQVAITGEALEAGVWEADAVERLRPISTAYVASQDADPPAPLGTGQRDERVSPDAAGPREDVSVRSTMVDVSGGASPPDGTASKAERGASGPGADAGTGEVGHTTTSVGGGRPATASVSTDRAARMMSSPDLTRAPDFSVPSAAVSLQPLTGLDSSPAGTPINATVAEEAAPASTGSETAAK